MNFLKFESAILSFFSIVWQLFGNACAVAHIQKERGRERERDRDREREERERERAKGREGKEGEK